MSKTIIPNPSSTNEQSTPVGCCSIISFNWECLEIIGPDAKDFLNRLTTVNFKFLRPGGFSPGALLTPTGKIVIYFKIFHPEPNQYLLMIPPGFGEHPATHAFEEFEKLHFRENLELKPSRDRYHYFRTWGPNPKELSEEFKKYSFEENELTKIESIQFDTGTILPTEIANKFRAKLLDLGFQEGSQWESLRIAAGIAMPPNEISAQLNPLEARIENAVHENKGCYPGQEVIERIRSMGSLPRSLVKLHGQGRCPTETPCPILVDGKEAGTLTSCAESPFSPNEWIGLGFLKRLFLKSETPYQIAGSTVRIEPL